jgi:hypothetical protein
MLDACILEPARIWQPSGAASWNQPGYKKFIEIRSSIQIHINPHNSHASYDKIQHHHLTRRNAIISQKFMDKEECKNVLVTMHNLSPHSFISMKFSSRYDNMFHEKCGNSFTNIDQQ